MHTNIFSLRLQHLVTVAFSAFSINIITYARTYLPTDFVA